MSEDVPPREQYATYWLTRDSGPDGMSDQVDVWLVRPTRQRIPDGAMWLGPDETGIQHRYCRWSVAFTLKECRVYPATDLECIKVGDGD